MTNALCQRQLPLPTALSSMTVPVHCTKIKTGLPDLTSVIVEPRIKNKHDWPQPQIKQVINGSIIIENYSKEPDFHKKHQVNLRRLS